MQVTTNIPITAREEYLKGFQEGFNCGILKAILHLESAIKQASLQVLNNEN